MTEYTDSYSDRMAESHTGRWYYGWNVLAVAFVFQAVTFGLTYYCFTFWVTPWMDEFQATRGGILFTMVLMQITTGLVSPLAGRALDRFSIRLLVTCGILSYTLALALISFAQSLWVIMLLYAVLVTAGNLLAGAMAAQTLAARWFVSNRGTAIGLVSVGTSFGGFVLPPIVTWLMLKYGWRDTHLILAGAMAILLVPLVWRVIRNGPEALGLRPQVADKQESAYVDLTFPRWTARMILQQKSFWIAALSVLPVATIFGILGQNFASLAQDLQINTQDTALLVSVMALSMICGKLFFGRLGDHFDHRYLLWLAGLLCISCLSLLILTTPDFHLMLVVSVLGGFSSGSILPMMGIIVSSRFGAAAFGQVIGLLTMCISVSAIAPWLAGYLRDIQGNYDSVWLICLCFTLMAIPLAYFLPKPPVQRREI